MGTVLGNLGVNTVVFCTGFNLLTKNIPTYFLLRTTIFIYDNRSARFTIALPSTGYFLSLLKFEKLLKIWVIDRFHEKLIPCIKLSEVLKLAKFQFPDTDIKRAFMIIFGSVKSMNLTIII